MRGAVLFSHSRGAPEGATGITQFALSEQGASSPSFFELNFTLEGIRYQYGFEGTPTQFSSEWLYWYPNKHQQELFTRDGMTFKFGRALKGQNEVIGKLVRANSLFLSAASQNNHEMLSKVALACARMGDPNAAPATSQSIPDGATDIDKRVISFLASVGTGISDFLKKEEDIDEKNLQFMRELNSLIAKIYDPKQEVIDTSGRTKRTWIELGHKSKDGRTIYFKTDQESAGTQRLLTILGPVFAALDSGGVVAIDEMSNSLHTKACETLVALFCNRMSNPRGAQLLAATHDTNLLRSPLMRRDQVWFVEKNEYGASHVYPLTDIRTRKSDDIEKGYLDGRFGAVPFAGGIKNFGDETGSI